MTTFDTGTLVKARGRSWVVLPGSATGLLKVRPVGGTDDETCRILTDVETVTHDTFAWPDPATAGDHHQVRLLQDALKLSTRASAGPFRSFGQIAVEPRGYQLVPLLMALRLDPIRLLIADDVGIGKTVEAALIAKELLATGTEERLCVLCPPHLAEQWQSELSEKFHIEAELVLASTASRLERGLPDADSLFDVYPYTIVSTDFIKTERRRDEFLRAAPNLVIVDEAHTCAADPDRNTGRHQRHHLLAGLAAKPDRHLILVTATPHSGNEAAFRSLLELLDPELGTLPDEETSRRRLARHLVQRRRRDIEDFLDEPTPFPKREDLPEEDGRYTLSTDYRQLVIDAIEWARESVADTEGGKHRQRVRWWGVLGLLRAMASSPAAAAATMNTRAQSAGTATEAEADSAGRLAVLDLDDSDDAARTDTIPGADPETGEPANDNTTRRRLRKMAERATNLGGVRSDKKLAHTIKLVKKLLADGYHPIVFCRFIDTAEYVAEHLRAQLPNSVEVAAATGLLPPSERETRVRELADYTQRILVATDCLSEGINLQEHFSAVVHYDLPWNPTRLEQREGRVDRYGQPAPSVRVATIVGTDNIIDQIVMDVLLRKHRQIRNRLGVSIAVPGSNDQLIETVFARLFEPDQLSLFEPDIREVQQTLFDEWDAAADREDRSRRTRYAQATIRTDEVAAELASARNAVGSARDVARFMTDAITALGGTLATGGNPTGPVAQLLMSGTSASFADAVGLEPGDTVNVRWELPVRNGETYLARTHPLVESTAAYILDTALDPYTKSVAARSGAIRTDAVTELTALVVVRYRFDLTVADPRGGDRTTLVEDTDLIAIGGIPTNPNILDDETTDRLRDAVPTSNIPPEQRSRFLELVIAQHDTIAPLLDTRAEQRATQLADAHRRVRQQAGARTGRVNVEPHRPVDVVGLYLLIPA